MWMESLGRAPPRGKCVLRSSLGRGDEVRSSENVRWCPFLWWKFIGSLSPVWCAPVSVCLVCHQVSVFLVS